MSLLSNEELAIVYRIFAVLLTQEVGETTLMTLRDPTMIAAFEEVEPGYTEWIAALRPASLPDLRVEFTQLFLLPGGAAPFASAWLEGDAHRLSDQLATLVHQTMLALGLEQTTVSGRLSLDHAGLLFSVAATALSDDDTTAKALGEHLLQQALGEWVVAFGRAVRLKASSPLYRALGALIVEVHGG